MPDRWTSRTTPAARVLARALEEHPDWTQQSLADVAKLNPNVVSRWLHAKSSPTQVRVADVARRLGYDPAEFGITDPRALHGQAISVAPGEPAPDWFVSHSETIHAYLQALELRAVTAEQKLDRILQTVERAAR